MSIVLNESVKFDDEGTTFRICIVDERPDMDLDPTMLVYRGLEEEPIATIHFRDGQCGDEDHISIGAP